MSHELKYKEANSLNAEMTYYTCTRCGLIVFSSKGGTRKISCKNKLHRKYVQAPIDSLSCREVCIKEIIE